MPICIGIIIFISANILNTTVKDNYLKVYGLYGNEIKIGEIEFISLEEEMPPVTKVINGFMLGNGKKKGAFKLNDKNVTLYLYNQNGPFIFIKTERNEYYLNLKSSEDTKELYYKILDEKE